MEDGVEAGALGGIFGGGDGLAVALDEAGYVALAGFEDEAGGVGAGVDFADAIAEGSVAVVVDDVELVGGGGLDPGARLAGGEGESLRWGLGAE